MWNAFKNWYLNSHTVLWARVQLMIGAVWTVLITTDMTTVIPAKWQPIFIPVWLMVTGLITEMLRRTDAPVVTVTVPATRSAPAKPVTFLGSEMNTEMVKEVGQAAVTAGTAK